MADAYIDRAKEILRMEAEAIADIIAKVDEQFELAIDLLLNCRGRVIVTGMGKSGIIGNKISATLASTGTPAVSLHPAEALHGDLGMVTEDDVVIAISNSGETEEVARLVPLIKKLGAKLIAMTGSSASTLVEYSDCTLDVGVSTEACPLGLAPTCSTTATLAMGDALAIVLMEKRGFKKEHYAFYHVGGSLGRKFLKIKDIMRTGQYHAIIGQEATVAEVIEAITSAHAGAASIVDDDGRLVGMFTDGDLRRSLQQKQDPLSLPVHEVMSSNPVTISPDRLVSEAPRTFKDKKVDEIVVVDEDGRPIGVLDERDVLGLV